MALRIRRGTNAQRTGKTFEMGEIVYTTDSQQMWVGDGSTQGGIPVVGSNVAGYGLTYNSTSNKIQVAGLTADDITNGVNNKFFSTELAQDAAALLFTTGSHTNISFAYDDTLGKLNATVVLDGIGLTDIVNDTSPSLGGNLDLNSRNITGTGNIDITGNLTTSGNIAGNTLSSDTLTISNLVLSDNKIQAFNGPLRISNSNLNMLEIIGINNDGDVATIPQLNLYSSRGTIVSPANSQPGDYVSTLNFGGYYNSSHQYIASIICRYDDSANLTNSTPGSAIGLVTNDNNGGQNIAAFDMRGVFTAPILAVTGYATGSLPDSPDEGFMVFDSTTKQFKGWNGSSWVVLG